MDILVNRRKLIVGAGSTVLVGALRPTSLFGIDFGSVFGTVLGAAAVGLFPGAAAALGGFELVRFLGNAADVAGNANNLVTQTQQLENHFDSVLSQVSATLATVQSFVQDCDNALHDIENLIKDLENLIRQLPSALVTAFDEAAAKTAFARLRADSANMAGYLQSKGSIVANKTQIQNLTEKIVTDISTIDALAPNMFQSLMQMVPGLATWVQGYTAYNLLVASDARGTNPWDHQVVSAIGLPRINAVLQTIQQQLSAQSDLDAVLPLEAGVLYTFNGSTFTKANHPFAPQYMAGQIDNGFYYVIWPENVTPAALPQGVFVPALAGSHPGSGVPGTPQAGDITFLGPTFAGSRIWWELPWPFSPMAPNMPQETLAAQQVAVVYPRMLSSTLRNVTSLTQLTTGWQVFERAVNTNLKVDDQTKTLWTKLPTLTA